MTSWNGPLVRFAEYDHIYHSRLLLDIGKSLYTILLPTFGWIDFGQTGGHTWFEDLEQSRISHIYWANYFGLDYLSQVGREKVENAPAWSYEPLKDGGGALCSGFFTRLSRRSG